MFVIRTDASPVSVDHQQEDVSKGSFKTKLSGQQKQKEEREEQTEQTERRDNPHETAVSVDASDEYDGAASDEEERVNPSLRGWDLGATYDRAKKRLAQALEDF